MKYDIYFHNDFDGRASAAIMLAFLRSRGDDIEHYVPVDFDILAQWTKENFFIAHKLFTGKRYPAIVVDFPFHPKAAFWFDHHETPFKKEGWKKRFKPDAEHHLYSDYPSCCHVVYDGLRESFGWKPAVHLRELVRWADIIDHADYRSAKQTLLFKEPALQVDAFIDATAKNHALAKPMVKWLSEKSFEMIARTPKIRRIVAGVKKRTVADLRFYKKNLVLRGKASFVDLTADPSRTLRYAPYYLFPNSHYAVRLSRKGHLYHLGIGANPWKKFRKRLNIGVTLKKYGGGGHADAGAADFVKRSDAERALREVFMKLNK
jgi:hypothetical protein